MSHSFTFECRLWLACKIPILCDCNNIIYAGRGKKSADIPVAPSWWCSASQLILLTAPSHTVPMCLVVWMLSRDVGHPR